MTERDIVAAKRDRVEESPVLDECAHLLRSAVIPLAVRTAYLGLEGSLWATPDALKQEFQKCGNIGKQLSQKMSQMEANHWVFGNIFLQHPVPAVGWQRACEILDGKTNLAYDPELGMIGEYFKQFALKARAHQQDVWKIVAYNGPYYAARSIISGASSPSPLKTLVPIVAHEIAHNDGILKSYSQSSCQNMSTEEKFTVASRNLLTEVRAHLTEAAAGEARGVDNQRMRTLKREIKAHTLGSYIHSVYKNSSGYATFDLLDEKQADRLANEYIGQCFGEDLIDPKTNKFRDFDINAGVGKPMGHVSGDEGMLKKMNYVPNGWELSQGSSSIVHGLGRIIPPRVISRAMQAVAGVGAITAAADLSGAFKTGTDAGIARIGRSWLDYAGYEVGGNLACKIAKLVPRVGPLAPMLIGGIACSHLFDTLLGSTTEGSIKTVVNRVQQYYRSSVHYPA